MFLWLNSHVYISYVSTTANLCVGVRASTLNFGSLEARSPEQIGRSPRIGKRELQQQRRSRTIGSLDDTETVKKKQKPVRASDELKVKQKGGGASSACIIIVYVLYFVVSLKFLVLYVHFFFLTGLFVCYERVPNVFYQTA